MPIEELQNAASGNGEMVRPHSSEAIYPVHQSPNRSPPQPRTKQWEENEAVLMKLFPDVDLQTITDALEFCHGNRNDAIDLLAEQNKLSSSNSSQNNNNRQHAVPPENPSQSDPAGTQNFATQALPRLPFTWHRTQHLIPDPASRSAANSQPNSQPHSAQSQHAFPPSLGTELQKEFLAHEYPPQQLQQQLQQLQLQQAPLPPLPSIRQPKALRNENSTTDTPPQQPALDLRSPTPPTPISPQLESPSSVSEPSQVLKEQPKSFSPPVSTTRTPPTIIIPQSPPPQPLSPQPPQPGQPPDVIILQGPPNQHYQHFIYYQQIQPYQTYQPLISPLPQQSSPSPQLPPRLSLPPSPLQSPRSPPTSPRSSNSPRTPTSPTSPTSPPTSPRLHHQYTHYRYAYRQSAPSHSALHHYEAYSDSPDSDASSYQSHSHPVYSPLGGYASYGNNYSPTTSSSNFSSGNNSASSSFGSLPNMVKQKPPSPLAFRIVGATRNTYYMDYIVEVITPELRWLVYRRYSNFSLLNAKLLKLGLAHPSKNVIPPKQFCLPPFPSPFASDDLVQRRIDGLGSYLNSLVDDNYRFFLNHPIGQTFIDPHILSNEHNKIVNTLPCDKNPY